MCGVHVCEVCLYVRMYMYVCMCGMYEHMTSMFAMYVCVVCMREWYVCSYECVVRMHVWYVCMNERYVCVYVCTVCACMHICACVCMRGKFVCTCMYVRYVGAHDMYVCGVCMYACMYGMYE